METVRYNFFFKFIEDGLSQVAPRMKHIFYLHVDLTIGEESLAETYETDGAIHSQGRSQDILLKGADNRLCLLLIVREGQK